MYRTYKIAATREINLSPDSEAGLITPSKRKEIRDISDGKACEKKQGKLRQKEMRR